MLKLQQELKNFLSQYEFLSKAYKYDIILIAIYPAYFFISATTHLLFEFWRFSSILFVMFWIGMILCFANNKIKTILITNILLSIAHIINVFSGDIAAIVYVLVYSAIAYNCIKLLNKKDNYNTTVNYTETEEKNNEKD